MVKDEVRRDLHIAFFQPISVYHWKPRSGQSVMITQDHQITPIGGNDPNTATMKVLYNFRLQVTSEILSQGCDKSYVLFQTVGSYTLRRNRKQ